MIKNIKIVKYLIVTLILISVFNSDLYAQEENISKKIVEKYLANIKERLVEKGLNDNEIIEILKIEEQKYKNELIGNEKIQNNILSKLTSSKIENNKKDSNVLAATACGEVPANQKAALLALLAGTQEGGSLWTNATNWNINNPVRSYYLQNPDGSFVVTNGHYVVDPQGWFGVTVINCNVVSIDLPNNHLNGKLPNLTALQFLTSLNLATNSIYELHNSNIGSLVSLQHINLQFNSFGYGVNGLSQNLTHFVTLTNLLTLNLANNDFNGSIPISINSLTKLNYLNLRSNNLSGDIPQFTGLINLTFLDLSYYSKFYIYIQEANTVFHAIPSSFQNLIKLQYLYLNGCGLYDIDPIGGMQSLKVLTLDNNRLENSLPSTFIGLHSLSNISFINNKLTNISILGSLNTLNEIHANNNLIISSSLTTFSSLTNLLLLNLSVNNLSVFPPFGNSINLRYLYLGINNISENIPVFLNNLINPIEIDFGYNFIDGLIPNYIFNKPSLQYLRLSKNKLSGNIPSVTNLNNLTVLMLNNNFLIGSLPNTFQNLPKLVCLHISNNQLEGIIPNLTGITSLKILKIDSNKFRFKDFVNEFNYYLNFNSLQYAMIPTTFGSYSDGTSNFICYNQAEIDDEIYITKIAGSSITLTMYESPDNGYLSDDTFQWYNNHGYNSGESVSNRQLTLTNLNINDSGDYVCWSRHNSPPISTQIPYNNNPFFHVYQGFVLSRKRIHLTVVPPPPCYDCTSFDLIKSTPELVSKYLVSGWVKEEDPTNPLEQYKNFEKGCIGVSFTDVNGTTIATPQKFYATGEIIDGWQRIVGEFVVPDNVDDMKIELLNENTDSKIAYFDDIRVLPTKGNMKSFVYDQKSQRLMAELDENNYGTFYEYDLEGGLVRIKKETEKGVFTIQETRSGNAKN